MKKFTVKTEVTITSDDIANMVITAFEGGISYWCGEVELVEFTVGGGWEPVPQKRYDTLMIDGCGPYANPELWDSDTIGYRLTTDEGEVIPVILCTPTIIKALNHPLPRYEDCIKRLLAEDYDAWDADNLVQSAVFNEIVYG